MFSPIATWADSMAWFMVRAQMWRLWTAVTPFTASRRSLTSLYFTPDGVPEQEISRAKKRGRRGNQRSFTETRTACLKSSMSSQDPHLPSGPAGCPSWWWRSCTRPGWRTRRCRWGRRSYTLAGRWKTNKSLEDQEFGLFLSFGNSREEIDDCKIVIFIHSLWKK